ncbi:hypothetical protein LOK49_LG07G00064 [Camellia lanceoleosa]|uniref:Uncharacterized protein n=1 Tax=Camellia lanceoleosa TaxID=1840588 RepID=A0ACC0H2F8_9ERIC|nr:hypothetical protein LOK49_LG07G00064 [Camellia lanceoleosa]
MRHQTQKLLLVVTRKWRMRMGGHYFILVPQKWLFRLIARRLLGQTFARIAPACAFIANIIIVHNLFDALTSSSGHRLHFLIYDKYLRTLEKAIKAVKSTLGPQSASNLQLAEGEFILGIDGTVPTQLVLQHIAISAWPGRLTLTNYALYFESLGVGL